MKFKHYLTLAICIFTFCVVGIYFVFGPMHTAYFQWVPHHGEDFAKVHPDLEQKAGEGTEGIDLAKAIIPTAEVLAEGKKAFEMKCAACHGVKGDGSGAPAVKPRNFTSLEGWTNGPEFANVFKSITKGVPGTGMAPFGTESVETRIALAHYVQQFANYPKPGASDIAQLDSEFALSQGSKTPNVIPVVKAIQAIDSEFRAANPDFKTKKVEAPVAVELPESEESTEPATEAAGEAKPMSAADLEALKAEGAKLYQAKCVACHQANGQGMPGAFPPLAQADYLAKATVKRFVKQVSGGSPNLQGRLTVNGVKYTTPMAPMTQDAKELTALANFVLNSWGNSHGPVTETEVIPFIVK